MARVNIRFRLPVEGGAESQVLESVYQRAFAVTERGIYFNWLCT